MVQTLKDIGGFVAGVALLITISLIMLGLVG